MGFSLLSDPSGFESSNFLKPMCHQAEQGPISASCLGISGKNRVSHSHDANLHSSSIRGNSDYVNACLSYPLCELGREHQWMTIIPPVGNGVKTCWVHRPWNVLLILSIVW